MSALAPSIFVHSPGVSLLSESVCALCHRPIYLRRDGAWGGAAGCGVNWHAEADGGFALTHVPVRAPTKPNEAVMRADRVRSDAARKIQDLWVEHMVAKAGLPKGRKPRTRAVPILRCLQGR
jgi:hypothetical protein